MWGRVERVEVLKRNMTMPEKEIGYLGRIATVRNTGKPATTGAESKKTG